MSMDFVAAWLTIDATAEPDWGAALAKVDTLTAKELSAGLDDCYGGGSDDVAEMRQEVRDIVTSLQALLDNDDVDLTLEVRGARVHLGGGQSWGDDPSKACTTISNALNFPTVLRAAGFDMGPDEVPKPVLMLDPEPDVLAEQIEASLERESEFFKTNDWTQEATD